MKKILYIGILILIVLAAGCDNRKDEKPTIAISLSNYQNGLYLGEGDYEFCNLNVQLTGKASQIDNVTLNMAYDGDKLRLSPNAGYEMGDAFAMHTNSTGYASTMVLGKALGSHTIQIIIKNYGEVSATQTIVVKLPEIVSLTAVPDTILANGSDMSTIVAKVFPHENNDTFVKFRASSGTLEFPESVDVPLNTSGQAINTFTTTSPGWITVTAYLTNYPQVSKEVSIIVH